MTYRQSLLITTALRMTLAAAPPLEHERRSKAAGKTCCDRPFFSFASMRCEGCGCKYLYGDC